MDVFWKKGRKHHKYVSEHLPGQQKIIFTNATVFLMKMKNLVSPQPTAFVNQDNCRRRFKVNWTNPLIFTKTAACSVGEIWQCLQAPGTDQESLKNMETDLVPSEPAFHACQLFSPAYTAKDPGKSIWSPIFRKTFLLEWYEVTIRLQKLPLISYF